MTREDAYDRWEDTSTLDLAGEVADLLGWGRECGDAVFTIAAWAIEADEKEAKLRGRPVTRRENVVREYLANAGQEEWLDDAVRPARHDWEG